MVLHDARGMAGQVIERPRRRVGPRAGERDLAPLAHFPGRGQLLRLPVDRIRPSPRSVRQVIDERALDELAASIVRWGQLQPIVVRRADDGYELVGGERRWRAHQRAGLATIWAIERDTADADSIAVALVENVTRVGLSRAEKVAALDQLAELTRGQGLRRVAAELRIDPGWLSRQLAVRHDAVIFPALEAGRIGFGQATELLRAPEADRPALLERIVRSPEHVPTAMVRAWVEEARARRSSPPREDQDPAGDTTAGAIGVPSRPKRPDPSPYRLLLDRLEALGAPTTEQDQAALRELIARAERLLAVGMAANARPKRLVDELCCLLCGECIEVVVEGTTVRPLAPGNPRLVDRRIRCGRCGGSLVRGDRRASSG